MGCENTIEGCIAVSISFRKLQRLYSLGREFDLQLILQAKITLIKQYLQYIHDLTECFYKMQLSIYDITLPF